MRELTRRALFRHVLFLATVGEDVPQAKHAHGLLPSGYHILDGYFPGMMQELCAGGAVSGDLTAARFLEVASLLAPPTAMMAPSIAWRVALGGVGTAPAGPARKVVVA